MKKSDRQLGMDRDITRRDFIHNLSLASLGLTLNANALAQDTTGNLDAAEAYYPPVRTGMRGSHPGAFEVAHALAREGRRRGGRGVVGLSGYLQAGRKLVCFSESHGVRKVLG
jgi:hypothetical protein